MHLGSVLVGIMVGIVLGLLIGRLARRPRREEAPADFSRAGGETKWPVSDPEPAEPVLASEPVLVWSEPRRDQIDEARAASEIARDEVPEEPPSDGRQPLLEELLAANRRLMDEAQTRLSRESEDASAEPRPEQGSGSGRRAGASVSSGEDLLARSRRLTEDARQRLARENDPESG
jgi:hypothetical protein